MKPACRATKNNVGKKEILTKGKKERCGKSVVKKVQTCRTD